MPRARLTIKKKNVMLRIEEPTWAKFQLLMTNPETGKIAKHQSKVIEVLIKRLIEARQTGAKSLDVSDLLRTIH